MNFAKSYKSQRSALWKATLLFTLVSGFLIAADQLSIRCGIDGSQGIVDDLLGGLISGAIFYLYERHRLRRFSEQLHVIDLMNHHIRECPSTPYVRARRIRREGAREPGRGMRSSYRLGAPRSTSL
jgi:hypothetical protein